MSCDPAGRIGPPGQFPEWCYPYLSDAPRDVLPTLRE